MTDDEAIEAFQAMSEHMQETYMQRLESSLATEKAARETAESERDGLKLARDQARGMADHERAAHDRTREDLAFMTSAYESCEADLATARARVAELEQSEADSLDIIAKLAARVADIEQYNAQLMERIETGNAHKYATESALASARKLLEKIHRRADNYWHPEIDTWLSTTPAPAPSEPVAVPPQFVPGAGEWFCPACGQVDRCDEDGCCSGCGATVCPAEWARAALGEIEPVAVTEARELLRRAMPRFKAAPLTGEWSRDAEAWLSAHPKPDSSDPAAVTERLQFLERFFERHKCDAELLRVQDTAVTEARALLERWLADDERPDTMHLQADCYDWLSAHPKPYAPDTKP